jgi:hypothetical protein
LRVATNDREEVEDIIVEGRWCAGRLEG